MSDRDVIYAVEQAVCKMPAAPKASNEHSTASKETISLAGEKKDMQAAKDALSSETSVSEKDREVR